MCQGRTVWSPRRMRQRIRAGVTGRLSQGGGTLRAGSWCASAITSTGPKIDLGESDAAVAGEHDLGHAWLGGVLPRGQRSRSQRVAVDPGAALGEMDVQPGCRDMADELVAFDVLVVADGGDDVPVAERDVAVEHRERLRAVAVDDAGADGVDRGAVGGGDVDPEVERARAARDAGVVEVAAHRVRPVKRSERPLVHAG